MADYYLDHGRYTYSATPTWGVAQEGDGTGAGGATPATVSIPLSAYTAAAGATIAIGGATLTCVASGAGNNQFNAGSGTTLIDNIVTAINRATNTVTVTAAASGWPTPLLQNAVFARRNNNNLEIMTRAGSATYNANSTWKVVTTGFTGGPQIDLTFAGGAGGAWGWFFNTSVIWPSGIAIGAYTALKASSLLAGPAPTDADIVWMRARNQTCEVNITSASYTVSSNNQASFVLDDGALWPGDGGNTFTISVTGSPGGARALKISGVLYIAAKQREKLVFSNTCNGPAEGRLTLSGNGVHRRFENVLFLNSSANHARDPIIIGVSGLNTSVFVSNCVFRNFKTNTFLVPLSFENGDSSSTNNSVVLDGCLFDFPNYVGITPNLAPPITAGSNRILMMKRCNVVSAVGVQIVGSVGSTGNMYVFEDMSGVNITNNAGIFGQFIGQDVELTRARVIQQNIGENRAFRYETHNILIEWVPDAGYPTLAAQLPNGTPWSYSILWGQVPRSVALSALKLSRTIVSSSITQAKVEILLPNSIQASVNKGHLMMEVSYFNATGQQVVDRSASTQLIETGALGAGSTSWTYNAFPDYTPKSLSTTLSQAPKVGSDLQVELWLMKPSPGGGTARIFVCPELVLS